MTQLIDLGKLRFHFAGGWLQSTTYESNDVVKYGGNVYVYTYALKTAGTLPTDTSHWALMVEGFEFQGVFNPVTQYRIGDGIAHGGKVYICILDSTGQTPPNATYWSQFVDGIQYEGIYSSLTPYQKNDVVIYGGSAYVAKVDTTAHDPSNTTYWDKFVEGISPEGVYNNATNYVPNDLVAYGANLYKAKVNTVGHIPTNTTYWEVFVTGFSYSGIWSSSTTYLIGQQVRYGGSLFQAKSDNTNSNPTDTAVWDKIVAGFSNKGTWVTATSYGIDEVVSYGGNTFISILPHASTVFETDLAANKWQKFNSGVRWRNVWATGTTYLKDDLVKDTVGSVYIANSEHVAGSDFITDKTAGKWTAFVIGGSDVLPAIPANPIGKSLSVNSTGVGLDWIGATSSDNILYVAPHGVDASGNGKNISTPYASIKYACLHAADGATIFVKTGTYTEQLPIIVPPHVAIVGDNQRTVVVQPATGNSDDGTTLNTQSTMFKLSNGSILNKMTFKGMTGWTPGATAADVTTSTVKGVVVGFNPASPVTTKSPYVLECAFIGSGAIGALIDGSVHSSGNKTMIFHGYTVISDDGIGYWAANGGKAEIVSCFTYYCYFGYTSSGGSKIRALNGNNSYGTWGATSRGYDVSETPLTGTIYGEQLNFVYGGGTINVGDTVTGPSGSATVTNVQYSANKVYIYNRTGTFTLGDALTFTGGGTGTVSAGGAENQKGFILILTGLASLPTSGASIQPAGDTYAYVIQSVSGTYVNSSSKIVVVLAQEKPTGSANGTAITIRYKYSQVRLTGHDFLSIGTGGIATTNYPGTPTQPISQGCETDEAYPGRVYYVSTDQDGNFRVGEYFRIDQATGTATLNANAFNLAGLTSLRLGSIGAQLGETINEFSSDATLSGDSNVAVPTEHAVKGFVENRIPQTLPTSVGNTNKFLKSLGSSLTWETLSVNPQWSSKSSNYTAVSGDNLFCDTSSGIFTITLPSSAVLNDIIRIVDVSGNFQKYNLTLNNNGLKIEGSLEKLLCDVKYASITLTYSGSTYGWCIV